MVTVQMRESQEACLQYVSVYNTAQAIRDFGRVQ